MEVTNLFWSVILIHTFIYCLDRYLKRNNAQSYGHFLATTCIQIDLASVRWTTSLFNKTISSWAIQRKTLLCRWYSFGTIITLLLSIPSLILLAGTAVVSFENIRQHRNDEAILQPAVPGVNLPPSDLPYYIATLLTCTVVHEIGHAVAAVREQVPLVSVGLFLWLFIPAAFVELPTNDVTSLSPWKQLKIYCAGVWHNVILSAVAFTSLTLLPIFLMPLFQTGVGVYVLNLDMYSASGHHDFQIGDQLIAVNDCHITEGKSWERCLTAVLHSRSSGFCVNNAYLSRIAANDQSACCNDSDLSQSHLCFLSSYDSISRNHYCLRAREVSELSPTRCSSHIDCPPAQSCLKPLLHSALENETESLRLIVIQRKNAPSVLYLGQPEEIYQSVSVSNYVPRIFISPQFIYVIDHLLWYMFSFSAGLAILNVVPCVYMDGHHIVGALTQMVFEGREDASMKRQTQRVLNFMGTSLVIINIAFGLFALFS
uniref:Membrane-bound transcription factor site-2 protease n=1 Tax=Daphnia dolichocephala TaxID=2282166 RepID=A0A4Y7M6G0_9CRUS|nr:EOG090X08FA [Daphnia dolichocephala]